ncbi:GAF domain-containing protein [Breoghania corrubedonensis]|uniref:GAF domain-containing protein n=1 Tax=Breoghania corrubedonensis TaxID=665038 RepID=A0A2T5VGH8_9HYPH|nr:GAF domain-containing protein [Breoghania corrubedonensis]PTW62845.1 GAF domain-containing protein [Breoghania corrubedonensis]
MKDSEDEPGKVAPVPAPSSPTSPSSPDLPAGACIGLADGISFLTGKGRDPRSGSDSIEGLPAPILHSWRRCVEQGLSANAPKDIDLPTRHDLRILIESNESLVRAACAEVEALRRDLGGHSGLAVLTDAAGRILMRIGDDTFARDADKLALTSGASWAEQSVGTNAIGTALIEGQPLSVLGPEHFVSSNGVLNCSAAPIFDPRGAIVGVLDLSTPTAVPHDHIPALIRRAVEQIERGLFELHCGQWERMRLHSNPHFVGSPHEGLLAFDGDRLVGVNRNAVALLNLSWSAVGEARFADLFSVQYGSVNRQASSDECVVQTTGGQTLFARMESKPRAASKPDAGAVDANAAPSSPAAAPSSSFSRPHDFLDALPADAAIPRRRKVRRGTLIYGAEERDETGDAMVIMASGEARCFTSFEGKELTLFSLSEGDAMPLKEHIQVEIQKEGELYLLPHPVFERLVRTYPDFAFLVMPVIERLLRKSIDIIEDVAFHSVKYRLVRMVVDLAEKTGRKTPRGVVIDMRSSGETLAMRVGASRQTVSTAMAGLVRDGALERLGGGAILIPDLKRLKSDLEDLR